MCQSYAAISLTGLPKRSNQGGLARPNRLARESARLWRSLFEDTAARSSCERSGLESATLFLPKMLSGANAFEISDIERMNIGGASAGRLGRNNVTCPVVYPK
jgi:hypothetical protein